MAREQLGIATNGQSEAVRLAAIRDALDRAGLKPPTQVELGHPSAFEVVFTDIVSGSRAESRRARGYYGSIDTIETQRNSQAELLGEADPPASVVDNQAVDIGVVDAEVVEPEPERPDLPPSLNTERALEAGRRAHAFTIPRQQDVDNGHIR